MWSVGILVILIANVIAFAALINTRPWDKLRDVTIAEIIWFAVSLPAFLAYVAYFGLDLQKYIDYFFKRLFIILSYKPFKRKRTRSTG